MLSGLNSKAVQPIARKLVKDSAGSPLAIRLLAPLLEGSQSEKRWKHVHEEYLACIHQPNLRVGSSYFVLVNRE